MIKAVCVVLFVALGVFAFQEGPSKDVRARLFKQIMAEDAELRDCLKEQQPDSSVTVPTEEEMTVEELDLNRDGVKEYEVQLSGICACGAHNCTIYLYRRSGQGFESILEGAGGLGIEVLKTSTNGYRDIQIDSHNNAATEGSTVYKFDGKQYRESRSTIVQLGNGRKQTCFPARAVSARRFFGDGEGQGFDHLAGHVFDWRACGSGDDCSTHRAAKVSAVSGYDSEDEPHRGQFTRLERRFA